MEESSTGSEHMQDSHISRLMRTAQPELLGRFDTMLDLIVDGEDQVDDADGEDALHGHAEGLRQLRLHHLLLAMRLEN